ncbi:MAG: hypothetical protein IT442_04905 [Phycisphaeraceae bacterium]|nr:hypothetical protein [Phycisphaeraceae bacterium]
MFTNVNKAGQAPFETVKMRVMNRCGATALAVGDAVALDVDASDAATIALAGVGGVTLSTLTHAMFSNIVEAGAAPLNALVGVVTDLLGGAGADNTEVEIAIGGIVQAKVGGTNWSSARTSCGVAIMIDTTGANRKFIAATDAARGKQGIIISDVATDLSSTTALATVLLLGFGSSVGSVGA